MNYREKVDMERNIQFLDCKSSCIACDMQFSQISGESSYSLAAVHSQRKSLAEQIYCRQVN